MAIVTPSSLISEITGSVGSQCFGRNMGGAYVRSKPVVPYQRTSRQAIIRNQMKAFVAAWQALTDAQRAVYESAAIDYQTNARLGRTQTISGYNLFLRQQMNLSNIGFAVGFSNPSPILHSSYNATLNVLSHTAFKLNVTKFGSQTGVYVAFKASPSLSAGILHPNPHLLSFFADTNFGSGSSVIDLFSSYNTEFGAPVSGKRIAWAFRTIHSISGEASSWNQFNTLVA